MIFDQIVVTPPPILAKILADTRTVGFAMASDLLTGSLLCTLVASKPGGRFLELGTGTGCATAWLLAGMDQNSSLVTVENDPQAVAIAQKHLSDEQRLTFYVGDGGDFLQSKQNQTDSFDLIFADTWPGKYTHLDEALNLLKIGGIYLIDDMLPQSNWPPNHPDKVAKLIATLHQKTTLQLTTLHWSTGLIMAVKKA